MPDRRAYQHSIDSEEIRIKVMHAYIKEYDNSKFEINVVWFLCYWFCDQPS